MEELKKCACGLKEGESGFCTLHSINKTSHFVKLCLHSDNYRNMWENCRGPGQGPECIPQGKEIPKPAPCPVCPHSQPAPPIQDIPITEKPPEVVADEEIKKISTVQAAVNFGTALTKHALSGFGTVDEETYKERLEICNKCPYLTSDRRCSACSCWVDSKCKWASERCPKQFWGPK